MMSFFGWTLVKVQDCVAMVEAEKEHNERANRAEGEVDRCRETIAQLRMRAEQLDERADFAETTVKGLTTSNGALWSQNERLLAIVTEMRRAGFELVHPDTEPNDQVRTVEQDDADALKNDKTLVATNDD
jgi:predicted nuclease with TOPRIM domain